MRRILLHNIRPTLATQFPSLSRGHDINTNVHMFTQDVQLAVMPIGGTTNKHFAITLEGNQGECEKAEQLIAEIGNYDGYDPVEMVCNAVENKSGTDPSCLGRVCGI